MFYFNKVTVVKWGGWHIMKLCTQRGWAWGQGYCFQQGQGRPRQNLQPHFQWVYSTWATPQTRPRLPAAHFRQRHGEGRAVYIPGLCQMPPPAPLPASFLARSQQQRLYLQVRLLYHLHVTWAKNSEALFSSENSPTRALAAPWLLLPKQ